MLFIVLLVIATVAIAGAAAFFSVYGLAHTFSGTFWSVVVMGGSLEVGKLIAASYLYRYWTRSHWILKSYLIGGIVALMIMTSTGIFGYLSSGYQADVLPLKQLNEQIRLLDDERTRTIDRKKQIDEQLSKGPTVNNVMSGNKIDTNAAKTIREARKAQESLNKQYKIEQEQTTIRVSELDKQLLELKQQLVKTEAHIGPITYIASAFGAEPDNATKWLIFLIIFAFDPMAVALTIAVNNVIRLRQEEVQEQREYKKHVEEIVEEVIEHEKHPEPPEPVPQVVVQQEDKRPPQVAKSVEPDPPQPEVTPTPKPIIVEPPAPTDRGMYLWIRQPPVDAAPLPEPEVAEEQPDEELESIVSPELGDLRTDQYNSIVTQSKIAQLREHLKELSEKPSLTPEEQKHKRQIENLIAKTEEVLRNRNNS